MSASEPHRASEFDPDWDSRNAPTPEAQDASRGASDSDVRPDWLVGAEEGAESETARVAPAPGEVKLHRLAPTPSPEPRPGSERVDEPAAAAPGLSLASRPVPGAESKPRTQAWTAKGNSVPRLAVTPAQRTAPPPDEDDESHGPDPVTSADPEASLIGAEEAKFARAPVRPLEESWWIVVGERIATERAIQLGIVIGIAVIVAVFTFWPRHGRGASIARIEQHPERFENQTVRVSGRVEEVFPLGQGWVYDLSQGKQTITVFTRGAMPQRHQHVEVVGQVSTGYLDGKPRVAILEGDQP